MVSERERDDLRAFLPDVLRELCGVADLRRPFRCPSPGHDDSDPSAHYYENGQTVHCFGCGRTWDVFQLVGELDGIDGFPDQARAVADMVGYRLDGEDAPRPRRKPRPKPRPLFDPPRDAGGADCSGACGRAFSNLYAPGNEAGREWLRSRGLDDDDAMHWGLGFTRAPKEIMPEFAVYEPGAAGFVVIPFWNRDFSAAPYCMLRTVPGAGEVRNKEWRPKGLASPLFNEWMLSASLPVVFVTEGLIDAMALRKMLGQPVMALGGVANAKRLSSVLYYTSPDVRPRSVVVCMDEDDEGRKCRDRIAGDLSKMGVACAAFGPYPNCAKDADEWLVSGRGIDWDFALKFGPAGADPLYTTEWRDGR